MKELKYVKTFEQFSIDTTETLEEGFFTGITADEIKKFIEKNKDNVQKLVKYIKQVFSKQLNMKGQDKEIKYIDNLDTDGAISVLSTTADKMGVKGSKNPRMRLVNGELKIGVANTGKSGTGTNA